ncbi:MAG: NfeD family protein [Clostridia bacterium]|nr:NfeD family protein [Clostridia bacterium]
MPMLYFWLAAMVVFLIIEAATAGLATIWFALGALAALICALCGGPLWFQIAWFVVVSVLTLIFTRPMAKKYLNSRRSATNADRVLGMVCIVTEDVDNIAGTGAVSAEGKVWTARSRSGLPIKKGSYARAIAIEGVKLIVEPVPAPPDETAAEEN